MVTFFKIIGIVTFVADHFSPIDLKNTIDQAAEEVTVMTDKYDRPIEAL
jgi:hypothetical protein